MARTRMNAILTLAVTFMMLVGGCDRPPQISDTGHVGAWMKGNARIQSYIMISTEGEEYRFRWWGRSADGAFSVDCDPSGLCVEVSGGKRVGEYRFRTFTDPESGDLLVECEGVMIGGQERAVHYIDRLVLDPDGLGLWSYVEERSGETFEGDRRPKRRFEKVSDDPEDVPTRLVDWDGD